MFYTVNTLHYTIIALYIRNLLQEEAFVNHTIVLSEVIFAILNIVFIIGDILIQKCVLALILLMHLTLQNSQNYKKLVRICFHFERLSSIYINKSATLNNF